MRSQAHRLYPTSGINRVLFAVFNGRHSCGLSSINGMSVSRFMSVLSSPAASANRIPLSLISAISQRISSSIETHLACISRRLSVRNRHAPFWSFLFRNEGACKSIYAIQAMFFNCQIYDCANGRKCSSDAT